MKADPVRWEAYKARQREAYAKRKADPVKIERMKQQNSKWHQGRYRGDAEYAGKKRKQAKQRYYLVKDKAPAVFAEEQKAKSLSATLRRLALPINVYLDMEKAQAGLCAICGRPETKIKHTQVCRLSVDHDHTTGQIRGLLCDACNRGLGFFGDSASNLWRAFQYLVDHEQETRRTAA